LDEPLPHRFDQWQAAVDTGLQTSTLFVQVLGALPGRKIIGSDEKLVLAQFDRAQAAGKWVVTWRSVASESVSDARMRELVSAAEYAVPLEQVKAAVHRHARPPERAKVFGRPGGAGEQPPPMVFSHAGGAAQLQAEWLANALTQMACFTATRLIVG